MLSELKKSCFFLIHLFSELYFAKYQNPPKKKSRSLKLVFYVLKSIYKETHTKYFFVATN